MLDPGFYRRPADRVARDLLGAALAVRGGDGKVARHAILEVEAYLGAHDLACHGRSGPTRRNATMFGPAGRWYVYLCYGIHWMLNVVTGEEGQPAAVLVRGAGALTGPGRLTKALGIDRTFDGLAALPASGLWIERPAAEDGTWPLPPARYRRTPRIGVEYAGDWADAPLRFLVEPPRPTRMGGVLEADTPAAGTRTLRSTNLEARR